MKKIFSTFVFCLFSIALSSACDSFKINNPVIKENMENIEFIPKEFHDVNLSLHNGKKYPCTPRYPEDLFESNIILLNAPKKIIYKSYTKDNTPIIPLCAVFAISFKRAYKYDHLSTEVIHVKKAGEDTIYSGEVVDPNLKYEYPDLPPNYEEKEKERQNKIKEAQKYSDEELDEGIIGGYALNLNLFEFVDIPLSPGKYEIYMSRSNLDSNKVIVEIIMYDNNGELIYNDPVESDDIRVTDEILPNDNLLNQINDASISLESDVEEDLPEI